MKYVIVGTPQNYGIIQELGYSRVECIVGFSSSEHIYGIPVVAEDELKSVACGNMTVFINHETKYRYENLIAELDIRYYFVYNGASDKKYILFGAGTYGKAAYNQLGSERVFCFLDNNRSGSKLFDKNIISFSELGQYADKYKIMICSVDFIDQMEKQLKENGFYDYDIYTEKIWLPQYYLFKTIYKMEYTEILANYNICNTENIIIYGINEATEKLICEIAFQNRIENILGVVDRKKVEIKDNENIAGIPVISFEEALKTVKCLVINVLKKEDDIREYLEENAIAKDIEIIDIYNIDQFVKAYHHPELAKYKNIHKGKRVFLVGNGPSLRIEDLETLHKNHEICFGANKIYRIYNKTNWRADYLCLTDYHVIDDCGCELDEAEIKGFEGQIFYGDCFHSQYIEHNPKRQYIHVTYEDFFPNYPGFSNDITKQIYQGYSVTYDFMLQIAVYMGFSEIYLIGNDCTAIGKVTDVRNHFIEDYYRENEREKYKGRDTQMGKIICAFKKAEIYSKRHGFHIYNATRGGKLEVFERVDFDSLF